MNRRRLLAALILPVLTLLPALAACEDDPILAPNRGARTKGSYGSIAVAPAVDSTASRAVTSPEANPELY